MMHNNETFRFSDLPKELRLMVYDRIPCINDHLILSRRDWSFFVKKQPLHRDHNAVHGDADSDKPVIIVVQTPPPTILATCRIIHDEALPIISKRRRLPHVKSLRVICGGDFLDVFSQQDGLLDMILNWTTTSGGNNSGNQEIQCNESVHDWLLEAELVTPKDSEHPHYATLTHIIDQVQQNLVSRHALPIEISFIDRNLHMFEQFVEIFYWRTIEKQNKATIKLGMAGPQYYENPNSLKRWEDTLSYVCRDLDDAMDMRSLVYGTESGMKILRAPRLVGLAVTRWNDEWGLQQ